MATSTLLSNFSWTSHSSNLKMNVQRLIPMKTSNCSGNGSFKNARGTYTCRITVTATAINELAAALPHVSVSSLKTQLLSAVAGLDRGLIANEVDVMAVDTPAKELEALGGTVDFSTDLDKLQGKWRLVYSSAFASGSLGGRRPGPPTGRLPLTLGQVFQRIDVVGREFDNIASLQIGTLWPLPPIEVTATLAHTFELIDSACIRIIFEKTIVQPAGGLSGLPPLELPQLPEIFRPPSTLRSGEFKVTFLDDDLRITRGDRGELRLFLKS